MLLHDTLATIGLDFLDVRHVEQRWHYLSFFERAGVNHVRHFNLVLTMTLDFDLGPIPERDKVAE